MDKSSIAKSHYLVQGRDLVLSDFMLEQIFSYLWMVFCYRVKVQYHIYSLMLNC